MMTDRELRDYLDNNYGRCKLTPCKCRDPYNPRFGGSWVGKLCPDWIPTGSATWEDLRIYMLRENTGGRVGTAGQSASEPRNQTV